MGIFDFFKKKIAQPEPPDFGNENVIETSLRKASTDTAYRVEFYKNLLEEKLIVLTDKEQFPNGIRTLAKDTNVNIVTFPDGKIPIFSSRAKIFDKGVITKEVPFLEMKGEDLFNLAKGAAFVLNPYSDYGKELLADEVESLVKGTILTDNHRQITVQKDTPIEIGQPATYPAEIVSALKSLFKERPTVRAAYLGWIYNPSVDEPPHLIFALDIQGDKQSITNEAGQAAYKLSNPNTIIDFIQIDDKSGITDYFVKQTTPFYTR